MSIDTLLTQLGLRRPPARSIDTQLDAMRRDVNRIGRLLARRASHHTEDWADQFNDLGREAVRQGTHLAEVAGLQAWKSAQQLRRDPLPAIAIIGTGLLLARLLRRR
jgi:hypothetical protein